MRILYDFLVDGKNALAEYSSTEKFFRVFWLLGPYFMLIERTPGDAYITILALAFLVKSAKNSDWAWSKLFWVKAAFTFWGICLLSAIVSSDPSYAFTEAFIWIRFPLFAMATMFWLGVDRRLLVLMYICTASALLLMCGILTVEMLVEGFKPRLSWPYGDWVTGNYLAKVGLPVVVGAMALAMSRSGRLAFFAALFVLTCLIFVTLTGERINALILICSSGLTMVVWMRNLKRLVTAIVIGIIATTALFHLYPEISGRIGTSFIDQLPIYEQSPYYKAMAPALIAFEHNPTLGIGAANFRNLCPDFIFDPIEMLHGDCHPHPHNYYVQMLGETGIVGLISGSIFLWSIVWSCFSARSKQRDNALLGAVWVVPFALFWPIASSADFFGQWNNTFMWSALALALASANLCKLKTGFDECKNVRVIQRRSAGRP